MSSKREEERNEKIIRGLMKLPPNRRCINCNSLGPQYVCTNFWTFVCMTCSGIHREFTHRVKSVSMAKFTFQEVDALQKGGNQRAKELFLKVWDPQRRLPDNSNVDKVRDFIKTVYVDKQYAIEKTSDKPPVDPQSIRSHEDEMRRASSFHSYSQSPPNDFQYEERRYGKHGPSLTRKPGSDHGIYEAKFSSFLSPSHFSDHGNNDGFANEGSYTRASDYSVSSDGDPFRSPSSQRDTGSPFGGTSRSKIPGHRLVRHNSDANIANNGGKIRHPQRTESLGSFGSFDSMSFKSVNSLALQEPEQSMETSYVKTSSFTSLPQSSNPATFSSLVDLFGEPFAAQKVTSTPTTISSAKLSESSLPQSVDLFQQSSIPSVSTHSERQTSDVVMPNDGGWATFDTPQISVPVVTGNPIPGSVSSSDGSLNPFSLAQSSARQSPDSQHFLDSASYEPSPSAHAFWHESPQNVELTTNNTQFWNAFEDSPVQHPIQNALQNNNQAPVLCASDATKSLGFGVYEALNTDGNVRMPNDTEPPSSSLSSHLSMPFSMVPAPAGTHSFANEHKPINPFDVPCDGVMDPSNTFWDMNSLQDALPYNLTPNPYIDDANESWFPQSSASSYVPGGPTFDPSTGSLGFIVGQTATTQISSVHSQGPVASVGGNPFA